MASSQKKQVSSHVDSGEKSLMKKHKSLDPVTKIPPATEVNVAQQKLNNLKEQGSMRKVLSPNNYGNKLKEDAVSRQQRITVSASFGKTAAEVGATGAATRQPPLAVSTEQSRN